MENTEYGKISFSEGSTLVVFLDGISESMDVQEEEYGEKRLFDQIEKGLHLSSEQLASEILNDVK